ncbi:MAG: V-type ATP synthase subunit E [Ruminococcaceae bacterium]|nr:V-type ATP synthase subunit E [Oscillospiraceae bacterium]
MEIHLNELIDQIKKDGVEAAEAQAKTIIDDANARAEKIIEDAKARAEKIIEDAKTENAKIVQSSEDSITQAGRNLLISFRQSVARELETVISEKVSAVYSSNALAEIIINALEGWAKNPDTDSLSVILNSDDLSRLEEALLSALKEKMLKGVTLKPNDNFDGGFRIAVNEGSAYYDYSTKAVVEMLSNYLSPKVTELLKKAE